VILIKNSVLMIVRLHQSELNEGITLILVFVYETRCF